MNFIFVSDWYWICWSSRIQVLLYTHTYVMIAYNPCPDIYILVKFLCLGATLFFGVRVRYYLCNLIGQVKSTLIDYCRNIFTINSILLNLTVDPLMAMLPHWSISFFGICDDKRCRQQLGLLNLVAIICSKFWVSRPIHKSAQVVLTYS